jgi:hypothetical protein
MCYQWQCTATDEVYEKCEMKVPISEFVSSEEEEPE